MHCIDFSAVKKLLSLLFDETYAAQKFWMHKYLKLIDSRIRSISPPSNVIRDPRQVSEMKYWKAHEFHAFLLYYCVPLLHDVMHEKYFDHFKFLVFLMR